MPEGQSFPERLRALRHRSSSALAPLWIEQLPPEEALAELRARQGALFRLQEARFLCEAGEFERAEAALRGLGALGPGLEAIRGDLLRRMGEARRRAPGQERVPQVPPASVPSDPVTPPVPGPVAPLSVGDRLSDWLESVRAWRRVLRV